MSDIVRLLRAPIGYYGTNSEDGGEEYCELRLEAANEIERLRTALQQALTYLNEIPPRWKDARRALEGGK